MSNTQNKLSYARIVKGNAKCDVEQNISKQGEKKDEKQNEKQNIRTNGVKAVVNVKKPELIKNGYKDFNDWASRKDHLYIGREMSHYVEGATKSIWGNPFPVAKPGQEHQSNRYTLEESLIRFREHIESRPDLIAKLPELEGKVLGCWCKPSRCHGDVLTELVEKYCKDKN